MKREEAEILINSSINPHLTQLVGRRIGNSKILDSLTSVCNPTKKILFFLFESSDCGNCLLEGLQSIKNFSDTLKPNRNLIFGLTESDDIESLKRWKRLSKSNFPFLIDENLISLIQKKTFPVALIIDSDQRIVNAFLYNQDTSAEFKEFLKAFYRYNYYH